MAEFKKPTYKARKWVRLFFRLALIGLTVGSCTQCITWLGQVGINTTSRPHRYSDYQYDDIVRQDYNRHYYINEED